MNASNKKKIFIGLTGFLILIVVIFLVKGQRQQRQIDKQITPTVSLESSGSDRQMGSIIRDFSWKVIGTTMPTIKKRQKSEIKEVDGLTRKYSPNGNYSAYLTRQDLVVENNGGNQISVDITPETEAVNFVWLTNQLVLLIEKEAAFRKIDRIYFIKAELGEKNFFAGSFPIKDRLNLAFEPVVFDDGSEVLFQDNARNYWQLSLIY